MAVKSTQERLEQVQTAIEKAEKGQSYSVNGQSVTRASLKDLYDQEAKLLKQLKAEGVIAAGRIPGSAVIDFENPGGPDED